MNSTFDGNGRLTTLSLAHLLNDWYMNYLQTLLPFLVLGGLPISKGAFLISAFTVTSSLLQPVFGYLVDQRNQRWLVYAGTLWMAVLLSLVGILQDYGAMVTVAALAGLGTAAFHPQASAMVSAVSGERKGLFQSVFIAAGNIGWALTPLMVVPFVQIYGLELTPVFVIQGIVVAIILWLTAPRLKQFAPKTASNVSPETQRAGLEIAKIVLIVALRSLAYFGLVAFLPLYLQHNNISLVVGSRLLFLMLFAGAMGGLVGGYLSDLFGRKIVVIVSLILATPLFYLFLSTDGVLSYILLALAGGALLASFSVTVVVAQEILAKNAAMASGLMLGFGIGIGGLGVGLMGMMAESQGIVYAVQFLVWLPLVAGLLGFTLKSDRTSGRPKASWL